MQVQRIGYGIRGFDRVAHLGHLWEMTPKDAQQRLRILRFWERHGLAATIDAFGVFPSARCIAGARSCARPAATPQRWRPSPADPIRCARAAMIRAWCTESASCAGSTPISAWALPARVAGALVPRARPAAAFGLHHRAHHRRCRRQDASCSGSHRPPGPPQARAPSPQAAQAPRGAHRATAVLGGGYRGARA